MIKEIKLNLFDRNYDFFYFLNESVAFNTYAALNAKLSDSSQLSLQISGLTELDTAACWSFFLEGVDIRNLSQQEVRLSEATFELRKTTHEDQFALAQTKTLRSELINESRVLESTRQDTHQDADLRDEEKVLGKRFSQSEIKVRPKKRQNTGKQSPVTIDLECCSNKSSNNQDDRELSQAKDFEMDEEESPKLDYSKLRTFGSCQFIHTVVEQKLNTLLSEKPQIMLTWYEVQELVDFFNKSHANNYGIRVCTTRKKNQNIKASHIVFCNRKTKKCTFKAVIIQDQQDQFYIDEVQPFHNMPLH